MPAPKPLPEPRQLEAQYTSQVLGSIKDLKAFVIPPTMTMARRRLDAEDPDSLSRFIESLLREFEVMWSASRIGQMAGTMWGRVAQDHFVKFEREYKGIIPINPTPTLQAEEMLQGFVRQNVRLIKSLHVDSFSKIEGLVLDAVQNGTRADALAKQLQKQLGVSRNRAALIARDQIGKATSQLTRQRLKDAGVEKAKWVTSRDERVRPSHQRADKKIFLLDEGLTVDGEKTWPGMPVRCRCSSVAVLDDLDLSPDDVDPVREPRVRSRPNPAPRRKPEGWL